jgi:hypothetical protein
MSHLSSSEVNDILPLSFTTRLLSLHLYRLSARLGRHLVRTGLLGSLQKISTSQAIRIRLTTTYLPITPLTLVQVYLKSIVAPRAVMIDRSSQNLADAKKTLSDRRPKIVLMQKGRMLGTCISNLVVQRVAQSREVKDF